MTTVAQVKKMVQPLLARHTDLALVGRWIYLKPVHNIARAVLIDRMLNPEKFRPQWAVVHLFQARKSFPLNWGEWLYNESSPAPGADSGASRPPFRNDVAHPFRDYAARRSEMISPTNPG